MADQHRGDEEANDCLPTPALGGEVQHPPSRQGHDSKLESGDHLAKWDRALAYVVSVSAVVTLGVLILQWRSMEDALQATRESNQISRETLDATTRPWVMLAEPLPFEVSSHFDVRLVIKNYGNSPASGIETVVGYSVREADRPFTRAIGHPSEQRLGPTVLAPGQELWVAMPIALEPHEVRALDERRFGFVLYGEIAYSDALTGILPTRPIPRTVFCYVRRFDGSFGGCAGYGRIQ
jgi:hypothetical protein